METRSKAKTKRARRTGAAAAAERVASPPRTARRRQAHPGPSEQPRNQRASGAVAAPPLFERDGLPPDFLLQVVLLLPVASRAALAFTSGALGLAVAVDWLEHIIRENPGLASVLTYDSTCPRAFLLLLAYFMDAGGPWQRWFAPLRIAAHHGWLPELPIRLTAKDAHEAKAFEGFTELPVSLRQWQLVGHRLARDGHDLTLVGRLPLGLGMQKRSACANGIRLHRNQVNAFLAYPGTFQTVDFVHDLPTNDWYGTHAAFRELILLHTQLRGRREVVSVQEVIDLSDMESATLFTRANDIITQQEPSVWGRPTVCRWLAFQEVGRVVTLYGDGPDDAFALHIAITKKRSEDLRMFKFTDIVSVRLFTTERPQKGQRGMARFPQSVPKARDVIGADDVRVLLGGRLSCMRHST